MPGDPTPDEDLVARANEAIARLAARPLKGREGLPGNRWHFHNRKVAEWGVVRQLAEELAARHGRTYRDVEPRAETNPPTPPDVIARNETGGLVGFEVSEVTAQEIIEINLRRRERRRHYLRSVATPSELAHAAESGLDIERCVSQAKVLDAEVRFSSVYREWTPETLASAMSKIVKAKCQRLFAQDGSEPYAERILVMHTDEPVINTHLASEATRLMESTPIAPFDAAWLILSFHPQLCGDGYYPTFRVA